MNLRRNLLLASLAAAAFCTTGAQAQDNVLRVGTDATFPPMEFVENGKRTGFDVELVEAIAKTMGKQVEWVDIDFKGLIPGLISKRFDMAVSAIYITDERKKAVSFAGPYFVAGQDLLVRKDETGIDGPKDLNGKRLCSMTGTTSAVNVKEKFAKQTQLMEQPGMAECATALLSGIVDAATTDDIILAGLASASRGRLRVVGKPFTQEYYGIGVKKGNTELKNKINNAITDMIQDGSWQRAISDNTRGVAYTPNAKYNPPVPNGKGNK